MNPEFRNRHDFAVEVTRKAGELALGYFDRRVEVEYKSDLSPVTVADRSAEDLIRKLVTEKFPGDGFLGEEFGDQPGTSGFRWVIDPIDGTKPFIRGVPLWGTLVGVEFRDDPVIGAAFAPALGQMWHAVRGGGAFRDGNPIHVSDRPGLDGSLFCFSGVNWFRAAGKERAFLDLCEATGQQRGWGDFYGFVLVAQGSADLMVDTGVHAWDVAALVPIVEEAGGTMTDWTGKRTIHRPDVIASNGKVHESAIQILAR